MTTYHEMRILWLSHRSTIGGAELGLAEGVTELTRRGHEVHVILPEEGVLRERLKAAASVTVCHHNPWVGQRRGPILTTRWMAYNALVAAPSIRRIIRSLDADVVISNTITVVAGALATRGKVPHVWFLREFGARDHGFRFLLGEGTTCRLMTRFGDMFIMGSDALKTHYVTRFPSSTIRVVRPAVLQIGAGGVITSSCDGPLGDGPRRFSMILVGRRTPSKGQHEAILALSLLARAGVDAELELVGDSDPGYDDQLLSLACSEDVSSRVRLLPFAADAAPLVAQADVALMCSRSEAVGRVTIEAMKLGKPIVGTAAGATPELIRHGWNGYLYAPGKPDELAHWVERLYRDPAAANDMGLRGRIWAERRFTAERYGADLETALHTAIAS